MIANTLQNYQSDFVRVYDRNYAFGVTYQSPVDYYSTEPRPYTPAVADITFPGVKRDVYTVSTEGVVFNKLTNKIAKPYSRTDGYILVSLRTEYGLSSGFRLNRIVAYQFCNPPSDTVAGLQMYVVNHINGNVSDNTAGNLEWITKAVNTQHAKYILRGDLLDKGRPIVNDGFVHAVCRLLMDGYSNTEIMDILDMEINNLNHRLIADIRGGYSFTNISSQYVFDQYSKLRYYTDEQFAQIRELLLQGKSCKEVYFIMQGKEYVYDRIKGRPPEYRSIETIRTRLKKEGLLTY